MATPAIASANRATPSATKGSAERGAGADSKVRASGVAGAYAAGAVGGVGAGGRYDAASVLPSAVDPYGSAAAIARGTRSASASARTASAADGKRCAGSAAQQRAIHASKLGGIEAERRLAGESSARMRSTTSSESDCGATKPTGVSTRLQYASPESR